MLPLCLLLMAAAPVSAPITFLGRALIPGDAHDKSTLTERLEDGSPHNRLGGFGSGIDFTGQRDQYVCIADRGPGDGAARSAARVHTFRLQVNPTAANPVSVELLATTLLRDPFGNLFPGLLAALPPAKPGQGERFDGEAIRVGRNGHWFISEEYGTSIREFDPRTGQQIRVLPIPEAFTPEHADANPAKELTRNQRGRAPNRGFEGLAITPSGQTLVAILQGPLLQDGGSQPATSTHVRVLAFDIATGSTRQYVYELDDPKLGISEILAIDEHEFLVLERDGLGGREAKVKQITRVNFRQATDVSQIAQLPAGRLPAGVRAGEKSRFLDLLDPKYGIAGETLPEKFEGLTWGPNLPDGRALLIVTVDNDFVPGKPSQFLAFALDPGLLPQRQLLTFER
jgi:hypothetical protein